MNQKTPIANRASDQPVKIPPVTSPRHDEALLDQAVAETFPASDPISPAVAERLEPGDVRRDVEPARSSTRVRQMAPTWIALGTAAVALLTLRALRNKRSRSEQS